MRVDELLAVALTGDEDDDRAWDAVWKLRERGDASVFEAASALLRSPSEKERGRGVDVLAQLGTPRPTVELRAQCADALLAVVEHERSPRVLHALGVALGHLRDARAVDALVPLKDHADSGVRLGVVLGLSPHARGVPSLIERSSDVDDEVRNWATFGLAEMTEVDTPELRAALVRRLDDPHDEVRGEALVGLAARGDVRVLEPLRRALTARPVSILAVEAARLLGDPALLPLLRELHHLA